MAFLGECPEVFKYFKGDQICDDMVNIAVCLYDGGDCCNPVADFNICSACECLDPLKCKIKKE